MSCRCHIVISGGVDKAKSEIYAAADEDELKGKGGDIVGRAVGYLSRYHRKDDFDNRRKRGAEKVKRKNTLVIFIVGQKSSKQLARILFFAFFAHFIFLVAISCHYYFIISYNHIELKTFFEIFFAKKKNIFFWEK